MNNQTWQEVQQKLELLKQKDQGFKIFGASKHQYLLNPCLTESDLQHFEQCYRIMLPDEYREFLLVLGNGGAGPNYGLLTLEESIQEVQKKIIEVPEEYYDRLLQIHQYSKLSEGEYIELQAINLEIQNFINQKLALGELNYDYLSELFPLANSDALDAITRRLDVQTDEAYFIEADYPLPGSLPICHQGCGWMNVVVITGEQRGKMWTAGEGWLPEFSDEQPTQKSFLEWYQAWLDDSIHWINQWET